MKKYCMAIGIALAMIGSSVNAGNLSSSYSFKQGHGKVSWRNTYEHNNYVARDWNGDGRTDVLSLGSVYTAGGGAFAPHAFVSNGDGSYRVQNVGGAIHTLTTEYDGDYFSGPIIVGNGRPNGTTAHNALNCGGMHCGPASGARAVWHGSTTADVDKDGRLDLIAFNSGTTIFSNFQPGPWGFHNGNGHTQHLGKYGGMNTGAFDGVFMDLDGDGYPEMITGSYWNVTAHNQAGGAVPNGGITVWKNNGGKSFSVKQQLPGGAGRTGVRSMIKNGGDIIVYSECGDNCTKNSKIRVYGRSGSGIKLKQTFSIDGRGPYDKGFVPRLVDVNGDGRRDLVVYQYGTPVGQAHRGIYLNNGNGTFRRLGTPIFSGVPKAGMLGVVIPTKANHDSRMDWIVVYKDGTFGTLMAPGGGNVTNSGGNTSSSGGGGYAEYVRGNGDLLAAFNRTGGNIEAWGRNHWNNYGKNEPHRKNKPNTNVKVKVNDITNNHSKSGYDSGRSDRFWQLGFVKDQLSVMNHSIINSNNVGFSFDDTTMFKGIEFGKNNSFNFGIGQTDEYGQVEDFVAGMSFGATDITIATDNTLLGWAPGQSLLNISDMKSRYINIRRSKSIKDWTLSGNMTYALAQGNAGYGYVKGMDDFHAMGFGVSADYVIDEDSAVKFGVSQPLRIERGALHFNDVIADMTPDGREIDYTMSYTTTVSKSSTINLQLSYASDYNHYRSEDNAKIMAVYKGTW